MRPARRESQPRAFVCILRRLASHRCDLARVQGSRPQDLPLVPRPVADLDSAWHLRCSSRHKERFTEWTPNRTTLPSFPKALGSAEYRTRLTTKLNCLIAVLEVAIAKITKSMDTPGANEDRLTKIRGNLENTLSICHRAKQTLDKTQNNKQTQRRDADGKLMTARDYVELTSHRGVPQVPRHEADHAG